MARLMSRKASFIKKYEDAVYVVLAAIVATFLVYTSTVNIKAANLEKPASATVYATGKSLSNGAPERTYRIKLVKLTCNQGNITATIKNTGPAAISGLAIAPSGLVDINISAGKASYKNCIL